MGSCISITWSYGYLQDSFLSLHTEKNITIFHGLERLSVCNLITRQQSCFLGRATSFYVGNLGDHINPDRLG